MAAFILAQLYDVALLRSKYGEILAADAWLKVLANILSSVRPGLDGRDKDRSAPMRLGLSVLTLTAGAARCGFKVHEIADEIEAQVNKTLAWRKRKTLHAGAAHHVRMSADAMGKILGITKETRLEAGAWLLGTVDGSREERQEEARERDRLRHETARRVRGTDTRAGYESKSLSTLRPWAAKGISRRTWERQRRRKSVCRKSVRDQ